MAGERAMGAKVVVSASLSGTYDMRYVVVDEATGEVLDDAQGHGYKTAQNAYRAHAYKSKSIPPKKKRHRDAAKRRVQRWCGQHPEVVQHFEQAAFYAMKAGDTVSAADARAILAEHGLVDLPFSVEDLMKHWSHG